jgi:hypothetical protein
MGDCPRIAMLNRYAHFVEEQRQAVASAMDAIFSPMAVNVAVNSTEARLPIKGYALETVGGP